MHHVGCSPGLLFLDQIQAHPFMRHKHSDYMHWSKTQSRARYNLATSGVAPFPVRELPVDLKNLEINGTNDYGYAPLQQAIAGHHGVDPECVVESAGTSMANHLAMAAIIEPGDEVLIEHPAYGPILDVAYYLQAKVRRFPRAEENGWILAQPDLAWKMRRLNDLYSAAPIYPGELLSVAAFQHVNLLREKARRIVDADRQLLRNFLGEQSNICAVWTNWGTTSFVRLSRSRGSNTDRFLEQLHAKFDTSAVPGRFFEMPDHFRIGMGVNTEMFCEGLNRIRRALAGND